MTFTCPDCDLLHPHEHDWFVAPNGERRESITHLAPTHPRAEVRDRETGEVLFAAVKGPLQVIAGGRE